MDRRRFIQLSGAAGLVALAPYRALAQSAQGQAGAYRNLLVLIELKGGNDGLNTVIPYADDNYRRLRPKLAIERDQVIKLSDAVGLHPALAPLAKVWEAKELAIVQGVGYPQPNLSHFRSIEIWDTASKSSEYLDEGWLARAFVKQAPPRAFAADGVVVAANDMGPLAGVSARTIALTNVPEFLSRTKLADDKGESKNAALAHILRVERDIAHAGAQLSANVVFTTEFPKHEFGQAAKAAAQLAANPSGIAAIRLTLDGFDTHAGQQGRHQQLLTQLGETMAALKSALEEINRWDSTLILTYAEFGRRPQENQSGGTDHGTVNAHFAMGGRVKGGLYGQAPNLAQLDGTGNLAFTTDFREIYATVLNQWWRVDGSAVLNSAFKPVAFLRV